MTFGIANFFHYRLKKDPVLNDKGYDLIFNVLTQEQRKSFENHKFLTKQLVVAESIFVESKIGIVNNRLNCWFSSLVHCLFGSTVSCIGGSLDKSLLAIQEKIRTSPSKKTPAVNLLKEYQNVSHSLGIRVDQNKHQDVLDLALNLIEQLPLGLEFKIRSMIAQICETCNQVFRLHMQSFETSLDLQIPEISGFDSAIKMTDLLWFNMAGWANVS